MNKRWMQDFSGGVGGGGGEVGCGEEVTHEKGVGGHQPIFDYF